MSGFPSPLDSAAWDKYGVFKYLRAWTRGAAAPAGGGASEVHVELVVMSKCPDASACISAFAPKLQELGSVVDVSFTFIGRAGDRCVHGEAECSGNKQQLCAQSMANGNVTRLLDFVSCAAGTYWDIPGNGQKCSEKAHIDWRELETCADGERGNELMHASMRSAHARDISVSCTVLVDSETFCVHNGNWESCTYCLQDEQKGDCLRRRICETAACEGLQA